MGNVGRENGRLLICTNAKQMVNEHGKEEGFRVGPPHISVLFVWACLADKPWLKVLLADLV